MLKNILQWCIKNWKITIPVILIFGAISRCSSRSDEQKRLAIRDELISSIESKTGISRTEVESLFTQTPNPGALEVMATECKAAKTKGLAKSCEQWFTDIKQPELEKSAQEAELAKKKAAAAERLKTPGAAEFACTESGPTSKPYYVFYSDRGDINEIFAFTSSGDELNWRARLSAPNVSDSKYEYSCRDVSYSEGSSCEKVEIYRQSLDLTLVRLNAENIQKYTGKNSFSHFSCNPISDAETDSVIARFEAAVAAAKSRSTQERQEQLKKNQY